MEDRRSEPRLSKDAPLFVKLVAVEQDTASSTRMVRCSTRDISASGLRLRLEEPLAPGLSVELWVRIEGSAQTYLLHGRVRWCLSTNQESGQYTGIEVLDGPGYDTAPWRRMVHEMLEPTIT